MSLSDRLNRVEASLSPTKDKPLVLMVHLVRPGQLERPVTRIRHGERQWLRRDGESEEAFQARAEVEAREEPGHNG